MALKDKRKKEETPKLSILDWLAQQDEAGKELAIVWDGGGDSGWVYFEMDGDQVENEYTETLVDYMYNQLNYGSWAGEFQANGKAYYNHATRTFEGDDYYSEDDNAVMEAEIKIAIPKDLWFESLHVECEANYDETPDVSVRFIVKNGFLTDEHDEFSTLLEKDLADILDRIFTTWGGIGGSEFRGCHDSWIIDKSEFKEEDGMLKHTIDKVEISTVTSEDRYVVLELTDDIISDIDESLKEKNEKK